MNVARPLAMPLLAMAAIALLVAACGGAGGGALPGSGGQPPVNALNATKLGVTLSGNTTHVAGVHRDSTANLPVKVTYNGVVVATGTLDGTGFAELTFTQSVPAGATVTVTIGSTSPIVVTVTLATAISATSADVVYNAGPPPTITVTSAADANGDGTVDAGDPQKEVETENPSDGDAEDVNAEGGALPSNLPIVISTCGTTTITVAPAAGAPSPLGLDFEEKVNDSDTSPQFEYTTSSFTGPLNFPYLSTAARIDLTVTNNGTKLVSIEAPIGSITGAPPASPPPSPCPSPLPTSSPS